MVDTQQKHAGAKRGRLGLVVFGARPLPSSYENLEGPSAAHVREDHSFARHNYTTITEARTPGCYVVEVASRNATGDYGHEHL